MNEDFTDVLSELIAARARFLVVGAHAMAVHGVPRATGHLDVWIEPGTDNARQVRSALAAFGAPVTSPGVTEGDLATPGMVVRQGLPPRRIDILTGVTGVTFEDAWTGRVTHTVQDLEVPFIGRAELIRNERAGGRDQGAQEEQRDGVSLRHRLRRAGRRPQACMGGHARLCHQ